MSAGPLPGQPAHHAHMGTAIRVIRWVAVGAVLFFLISLVTGVGIQVAVTLLAIAVVVVVGASVTDFATKRRR